MAPPALGLIAVRPSPEHEANLMFGPVSSSRPETGQ